MYSYNIPVIIYDNIMVANPTRLFDFFPNKEFL
jgi:hypothetical protein